MRSTRIARALFLLVPALGFLSPPPIQAQCSFQPLSSGTAVYYPPGTVVHPTISQNTNYWSAVAVRPDPGTDWDLSLHTATAGYPTCVTGTVASSVYGGSAVDVVIGDFNHNTQGSYYTRPYHYAGGGGATVEWDDGPNQLQVNGPWISRSTGASDVIECWDVYMEQGRRYFFYLRNEGDASLRLLFFQNPGATYWAGRSSATYETVPIANGALSVSWPADASDWVGVVVVNENGQPANYQVAVTTCNPSAALASATPVTVSSPERQYSFQHALGFTAVGVRATNPAEDWGIQVYAGPYNANSGACYENELAFSYFAPGKTEYVLGYPASTTFYARAQGLSAAGGPAQVEWDDGGQLVVDASPIAGTTTAADVLAVWDVYLFAGQTYRVHFEQAGLADLELGLFVNPGGLNWVPRSGATEAHGSSFYYTATTSAWHGVVVANDNGQPGTYELAVGRCRPSRVIATHTWTVDPVPGLANLDWNPDQPAWAVMGERSLSATDDWDLTLYTERSGGLPPVCFSNPLAASLLPAGTVDLVVADLHDVVADRLFFAHGAPDPGITARGLFEVDQGDTVLVVGDPPVTHETGSDDIVKCWDVFLDSGTTYSLLFEREGVANTKLLVFANPGGGGPDGYWTDRTTAVLELSGTPVSTSFTPAATGWHALIGVNEDGGAGLYRVGVYAGAVAVGDALPVVTGLQGIVPNPVVRGSHIRYALREAAEVRFEVVDATGRRVSRISEGGRAPGHWSIAWSGASEDGRRLAAGVYFLRMFVDGRVVEGSKLVLLP